MTDDRFRYLVTLSGNQNSDGTFSAPDFDALTDFLPDKQQEKKPGDDAVADRKFESNDVLYYEDFGIASVPLTLDQAVELRSKGGVDSVRRSRAMRTARLPEAPPSFDALSERGKDETVPWNVDAIKAPQAWARTKGAGVKVAIADSGVEEHHPDLSIRDGVSFHPAAPSFTDVDGHGTAVAGIVGARQDQNGIVGVAPECDMYALKVSHRGRTEPEYILAAMQWAFRQKMDVLNLSLYAPVRVSHERAWLDIERAAQRLNDIGCVVVGIAGNLGDRWSHWVTQPARAASILTVGSVNRSLNWDRESSYGPADLGSQQGVELAAPGHNVFSTRVRGQYATFRGSSFAAPHVTGAAALVKSVFPTWDANSVRLRLKESASQLVQAEDTPDVRTGWGLVDCLAAITENSTPGALQNKIEGIVHSFTRRGAHFEIEFHGGKFQNWTPEQQPLQRVVIQAAQLDTGDVAMLTSAIGRNVCAVGSFQRSFDGRTFEARTVDSVTVLNSSTQPVPETPTPPPPQKSKRPR